MNQLKEKDKIDLNKELPLSDLSDSKVTVNDFFDSDNSQVRKTFIVNEDLKRKLQEPCSGKF